MNALYVFVRRDLKMPIGKAIAQAIHAVHGINYEVGLPVIVLRVDNEEQLMKVGGAGVVIDAARTTFKEPTATCAALLAPIGSFDDLSLL